MKILIYSVLGFLIGVTIWLHVDATLDKETRELLESSRVDYEYDRSLLYQLAAKTKALPKEWDELWTECDDGRINSCAQWVRDNQETASSGIPDDSFFELYDLILADDEIHLFVRDPKLLKNSAIMGFIKATRALVLRDVVEHGHVLPETIKSLLPRHRHHLAQADILMDWMILVATTGILVDAAENAIQYADPNDDDLVTVLAPLSRQEYSARKVMYGEFQYMSESINQDRLEWWHKPNHWLNVGRKTIQMVIRASEVDRNTFWTSPLELGEVSLLDRLFDPVGWISHRYMGNPFEDYLKSVRALDMLLVLARGMDVSVPREEPPNGWQWQESDSNLCLIPTVDNRRIRDLYSYPMCAEIIEP